MASYQVAAGAATVTFWLDAKINSQNASGNYSIIDTRLNTTIYGSAAGAGYGFWCTGSGGNYGGSVWTFENETCCSGQVTLTHDEYGNLSSVLGAAAYNNYFGFNITFTGDITLPRIPKAPFVSGIEVLSTTHNSISASFSITDNGGSEVTGTSLSIYSDSELTQLVETKQGAEVTFTGLHPNRNYWLVGRASNAIGTRDTTALQQNTGGSIVRIRINGEWKEAIPYARVSGEWKEITPYIRSNGQWKEGI